MPDKLPGRFEQILGTQMHDDLSPDREEAKSQQIKSHYERHPEWTFVVADGQDDVVGFLTYRIDRSRRLETIENNAIDPAAQGATRLREGGIRHSARGCDVLQEAVGACQAPSRQLSAETSLILTSK